MSKQREKEHATPYFDSYPEGRIVQHFKLFSTYWFEFWSFKLYSVAVIKANLSALTVFMYCTHRHLHIEDKELHKCVHLFHATILAVVWQQQNAKWDIQWKRKNIWQIVICMFRIMWIYLVLEVNDEILQSSMKDKLSRKAKDDNKKDSSVKRLKKQKSSK